MAVGADLRLDSDSAGWTSDRTGPRLALVLTSSCDGGAHRGQWVLKTHMCEDVSIENTLASMEENEKHKGLPCTQTLQVRTH